MIRGITTSFINKRFTYNESVRNIKNFALRYHDVWTSWHARDNNDIRYIQQESNDTTNNFVKFKYVRRCDAGDFVSKIEKREKIYFHSELNDDKLLYTAVVKLKCGNILFVGGKLLKNESLMSIDNPSPDPIYDYNSQFNKLYLCSFSGILNLQIDPTTYYQTLWHKPYYVIFSK